MMFILGLVVGVVIGFAGVCIGVLWFFESAGHA